MFTQQPSTHDTQRPTRLLQHGLALVTVAAVLFLNGCVGLPAPAGGSQASAPAAEAGGARGREEAAPASGDRGAAPAESSASGDTSAAPAAPPRSNQYEAVTAGVTDDNQEWNDYIEYLNRHRGDFYVHERDVSERYIIQVLDETSRPVHDAAIEIYADDELVFSGRSDAGGQMLFHPLALERSYALRNAREFRLVANKGYVARSETFARYESDQWSLSLTNPPHNDHTQLDLLFLMDATGSMGDEIDKLKASIADVADQIGRLPGNPDVRYGLVGYRDQGDEFVVRTHDFTYELSDFQRKLSNLYAGGGGDTPEALNEALNRSLNDLSWREENTVRLIVLVADAPPHLDYHWERFSYDTDMIDAVRKGIKIFPVGASNLEADGEYVFRQLAQFTGGKFVFLTYEEGSDPSSGPGTETEHEVENYSVDTLDRLIVRLVSDELAKLSSTVTIAQPQPRQEPSPIATPTPAPPVQPVTCTIDIARNRNNCAGIGAIAQVDQRYNQGLFRVTLDPRTSGYGRARFDITYDAIVNDWTVNIGDSISNDGRGGDRGDQSNNAEVQIVNGELLVYGNDFTPASDAIDRNRLLRTLSDAVRAGETISLEISNERLGINYAGGIEVVESPYLYALSRQEERVGAVNYDIYAAFNRTIAGNRDGNGVAKVVVTLYPAR